MKEIKRYWTTELREHQRSGDEVVLYSAHAAALSERDGACEWTEDSDGVWNTGCGEAFIFTEGGGLTDNKFVYCYACGKKIDPSAYSDNDELDAALAAEREGT